MSYYYKYNFVSPAPVYAIVKEELKSYFDTGAIDDLMFPIYLTKCLQKLSRTTLPIEEVPLFIEDFQARLPDNFYAAREVWMCASTELRPYQTANSFYSQSGTCVVQIAPITVGPNPCKNNPSPETGYCDVPTCSDCVPEYTHLVNGAAAVYKTNSTIARQFRQLYLLKPGNISARQHCSVEYSKNWSSYGQTPGASRMDSFDIRDNKIITNFRDGVIHLIFYSESVDCDYNQLIPDNYRIKEYIEAFIKYKMFEVLTNQINDETFNQMQQKLMYYERKADEAYIMADIEVKKQTVDKKIQRIEKDLNRFNKYERTVPSASPRGLFNRNK
jgi:hypothetical protein